MTPPSLADYSTTSCLSLKQKRATPQTGPSPMALLMSYDGSGINRPLACMPAYQARRLDLSTG
jgi:hypothetical protein